MESSSSGGGASKTRRSGSWGSAGGGDPFDIPGKGAPVERASSSCPECIKAIQVHIGLEKRGAKGGSHKKNSCTSSCYQGRIPFQRSSSSRYDYKGRTRAHADGALGFGIKEDQLTALTRDHNYSALQQISGLANMLKTDTDKGISGEESDIDARKNAFGSNTYPRKKGRSFLAFMWDACKDLTLIILMVAAAVSLALGIYTEGIKEGWYDGASIGFAVLLVIFVDYKQSLQFQNLNEEKQNIQLEVVRGGRRIKVSIFDLVVGDVVPLKIGDQGTC
ncbi:unnamed protein product [Triticum turgidum subsp. durum]|uniref:Cation-transporting P-type ATPase N-terminal domain-containing protein n=1 Tax=Triticum turgidum subsp. durum TaxID=4567 RepID=A0A9R1P3D4_TRITD|nr:unnamed protein product [Triticum turgidum subsp. durum]